MFKGKIKRKSNAAQLERADEQVQTAQDRHSLEVYMLQRLRNTPDVSAAMLVQQEKDVHASSAEVMKAKVAQRRARERAMGSDEDRVR